MQVLIDNFQWALAHSPILTWATVVFAGSVIRYGMSLSKTWLFVAACAVPYGLVATMAIR